MPNDLNDWQKLFLESFRLIEKQPILAFLVAFLVFGFGYLSIDESYRFWRHAMLFLMFLSGFTGIGMEASIYFRKGDAPKEPKPSAKPSRTPKVAAPAPQATIPSPTSGGPVGTSPAPAQKPGD